MNARKGYALCEVPEDAIRHPNRQKLRFERENCARKFRVARHDLRLTLPELAKLLRVSVRTVQNWEAAAVRIPHPAYRFVRLMSQGKFLGPAWRDFWVRGDTLVTPEGHNFRAGDLAWWSLLIRQAEAFREIMQARRTAEKAAATTRPLAAVDSAAGDALQPPLPEQSPTVGDTLQRPTGTVGKPTSGRVPKAGRLADCGAQSPAFKVDSTESPILTLPVRPRKARRAKAVAS